LDYEFGVIMSFVSPVDLHGHGVRLEPLSQSHQQGLASAAEDGELWRLRVTSVPAPDETGLYISEALQGRNEGHRFAFVVLEALTGKVVGSTSYHDILPAVKRVEIGYTWYAKSVQRTHVNTACKLLLLTHAFESLDCNVVGWRTDCFNFASQRAIERLGAKKDGVIRGNAMRKDGTIRDTVMYSLTRGEWPEVRAHLQHQLAVGWH
jgi:RimJ/RimL family protein N-acetyltransferase